MPLDGGLPPPARGTFSASGLGGADSARFLPGCMLLLGRLALGQGRGRSRGSEAARSEEGRRLERL